MYLEFFGGLICTHHFYSLLMNMFILWSIKHQETEHIYKTVLEPLPIALY